MGFSFLGNVSPPGVVGVASFSFGVFGLDSLPFSEESFFFFFLDPFELANNSLSVSSFYPLAMRSS